MKETKLSDIFPEKPEFTVGKKAYSVRCPNLYDLAWIDEHLGGPENVSKILQLKNWPQIAKLVYHLLDDTGQEDFKARTATIMNADTGQKVERFLTGPEVLLTTANGLEHGIKMLSAVCKAISDSNPMVDEMVKKSLAEAEKSSQSTGPKSSTRSKRPTGGKRSTSRRSR